MNEWQQAERHADRALELFDRGFLEEAESELRKALAIQPDQADWQFNLGLTLEAAQRDREAMEQFERAAGLAPDQVHPNLAVASLAFRLQLWSRSAAAYERVLRLDPSCEEAHAGRIECFTATGEHEEAETAFYLAELAMEDSSAICLQAVATSLVHRRRFERAEWCLREAIRIDSELTDAPIQLAMLLAETDRDADALKIFSDLLRLRPEDPFVLLSSARLFVKLDRLPEAIGRLEHLLRIDPIHLEAHHLLADLSLRSHHYDRAMLEYQLVLRLHPMQMTALIGLIEALVRTNRLREAARLLGVALQQWDGFREHDAAGARRQTDRVAELLLSVDLNEEAATLLEADAHDEPSAERLRRLAMARYRSGRLAAGMQASRAVLLKERDCIRSLHNMVLASIMRGRLVHASAWLRRALRAHPRDEGLRRLRFRLWAQWAARRCGLGRRSV